MFVIALLMGIIAAVILACITWFISFKQNNVALVDIIWSFMIWLVASCAWIYAGEINLKQFIVFILLTIWAGRLSLFLAARNWGKPEDSRYTEIRKKYSPGFEYKSFYIIFMFQAVLAWIVALPLMTILYYQSNWQVLDLVGIIIILLGLYFEILADKQLADFKKRKKDDPSLVVCNEGLWQYSRHPNYFGEFCIWWGFYLIAIGSYGYLTIISPLLMSFLLLKFSGVGRMEADIGDRKPEYIQYQQTTSTFFPWFPKNRDGK